MQEHHALGAPALTEEQHRGLHTAVGLEHAARQAEHGFDAVVFDQLPTQFLVRASGAEKHALGNDHAAAPARPQAVHHVLQEQQFGCSGGADLHVFDDPVAVHAARERRVGQDDVEAVARQAQLGLALGVLRRGQHVAQLDAHVGQAAQREVHRGQPHHLRVHVVAEEGGAVQSADLCGRELVAQAAPLRLAVQLSGDNSAGRRVRQAHVVVRRHQEARGAGGRVVDGLADLGVDHLDDGADHMPRRAELAQLAGLLDLPQHMLEQVALRVGVCLIQVQPIDEVDHLGQHRGLVDAEPRAGHEVGRTALAQLGEEGKHLVAHEAHQ